MTCVGIVFVVILSVIGLGWVAINVLICISELESRGWKLIPAVSVIVAMLLACVFYLISAFNSREPLSSMFICSGIFGFLSLVRFPAQANVWQRTEWINRSTGEVVKVGPWKDTGKVVSQNIWAKELIGPIARFLCASLVGALIGLLIASSS